jgi:hypothetical protein
MVEKQLFPDMSPERRAKMLADNAYGKENRTYQKEFTQDEIDNFKSGLSDSMIEKNALTEAFAEARKEHTAKIAPINGKIKGLLEFIKYKSRQVTEEVYLYDDQTEGIMAAYNNEGELISTRKLTPDERQTKMRLLTGTNDQV